MTGEHDALITCGDCGYVAATFEWLSNFTSGKRIVRADNFPSHTSIVKQKSGNLTSWEIPPSGRAGGLISFGWLWVIFVALATAFHLLGVAMVPQDSSKVPMAWIFGFFLIPIWICGLGMLRFGYLFKNAKYRVTLGEGKITLSRTWRGKAKETALPIGELTSIDQVVFYRMNQKPVYGVEIKGRSGRLRFGSSLTSEEKSWLVADFKSAIASLSGSTAPLQREVFSVVMPRSGISAAETIPTMVVALAFIFVGWKFIPAGKDSMFGFREAWMGLNGLFLLIVLGFFVAAVCRWGTETRVEGSAVHLAVRKMRKSVILSEKIFDRASYHDIRTFSAGYSHGREIKRIELLIGKKSERLARWANGEKADAFAAEIRQAMGQSL